MEILRRWDTATPAAETAGTMRNKIEIFIQKSWWTDLH
jgi:hypothetical protein